MSNSSLNLKIIPNIPNIDEGDNISDILISVLEQSSIILKEYDVLCIAHKIFSKAEGCIIKLTEITPSKEAAELGKTLNKDPRKIEVVLRESKKIIRSFKRADQMKER